MDNLTNTRGTTQPALKDCIPGGVQSFLESIREFPCHRATLACPADPAVVLPKRPLVAQVNGGHSPKILAFIYPQEGIAYKKSGGYNHAPYLTSVDIIEALTGIDFLAGLPDDIEEAIERVISIQPWD